MEFLNEKQQNIIEFLKDNEARKLEFVHLGVKYKTLLVKVQMSDALDLVYAIEKYQYFEGADFIPNMKGPEFVAAIDRNCGDIINMSGVLAVIFNRLTPEQQKTLQIVDIDELNNEFNQRLDDAIELFAKLIDGEPKENEINLKYYAEKQAQYHYFMGTAPQKPKTLCWQDERVLLSYVQKPSETINNFIKERETVIIKQIIEEKARLREIENVTRKIESSAEYEGLRVAKEIKDTIPYTARTVTIHYTLTNGEILAFKLDTGDLRRMPYHTKEKGYHFSIYAIAENGAQVRGKIEEADGRGADIIVQNIVKIEYRGKTLWEAPKQNKNEKGDL